MTARDGQGRPIATTVGGEVIRQRWAADGMPMWTHVKGIAACFDYTVDRQLTTIRWVRMAAAPPIDVTVHPAMPPTPCATGRQFIGSSSSSLAVGWNCTRTSISAMYS